MKKWVKNLLLGACLFLVAAAAALIGIIYLNFISKRIYEDSTTHLGEIYGQVDRSLMSFSERNWGLLNSWNDYITLAGPEVDIGKYIDSKKEYWGFSHYYFIAKDGSYMTPHGTTGKMELDNEYDRLYTDNVHYAREALGIQRLRI